MTWALKSATTHGDCCNLIYESDEARKDGTFEEKKVCHFRSEFGGRPQTDDEWRANIKREIAADLSELNPVAPVETDVTALVK